MYYLWAVILISVLINVLLVRRVTVLTNRILCLSRRLHRSRSRTHSVKGAVAEWDDVVAATPAPAAAILETANIVVAVNSVGTPSVVKNRYGKDSFEGIPSGAYRGVLLIKLGDPEDPERGGI